MIRLTVILLSSKVTATVKASASRWYFVMPSMLVRIYLIPSCGSPHPPPGAGKFGTVNLIVASGVAARKVCGTKNNNRPAAATNKEIFLYFMESSLSIETCFIKLITYRVDSKATTQENDELMWGNEVSKSSPSTGQPGCFSEEHCDCFLKAELSDRTFS